MNSSKLTIELSNYTDVRNNITIGDFLKLLNDYDNSFYRMTNVFIIIPYLLIVIISFIGNVFVVRVCFKHQTTTNLLIGSLATSDLLMTVFNIPFNVARLLLDHWPFGQVLCFLVPFVQAMVVYVSSWTMAVIAFNRLKSVLSIGRVINSKRTLILTILLTWLVSGIMALPHSIFSQVVSLVTFKQVTRCRVIYPDSDYDIPLIISCEAFLTQYLVPLSIACCTYIKIGKIIVKQGRLASTKGRKDEIRNRTEQKRRRILMLFLVVAVFAICWFPINIYHLLADFHLINHNYKIFLVCHWFAMSSVCYNPFIYCWLNSTFRSGAKSLITLVIKCKRIQNNLSNNNSLTHHFNDGTSVIESRTKGKTESVRLHHL